MKPKILIVDDEELNILTFESFLIRDDYEVHVARNGREALAQTRAVSPDLILLDVMMPEMDGYTVCRQLRADPEFGRVPIIMVTALHDSASRLEGLQAGADDFVTKPCSRDEMRARVSTIVSLNRFRAIAEARERMNAELERQVHERTRQLRDANAMLLSYANFVTHDLRSPLTVVKGYLSLLREANLPEDSRQLVDGAHQATLMMQDLVQNILQLARDEHEGDTGEAAELIDPKPVIQRVWSHVRMVFPQVTAEFTVRDLPPVAASAVLLERVFYNLLTNAVKFSAGRTTPCIEIGALLGEAPPVFYVQDNGVGFSAEQGERLFRAFSQLGRAPTGDGVGLGLSLIGRLVHAHGGRMWAESQPDQGARFLVQFSGARPAEAPSPAAASPTA
ncbi:response regulator [Opitutus sp. ER46]|uniref:sensor histidine kinase n=1 Tax=Opitutus sp. ER46 TaxID=2161864 RepID=UPI000D2FAC41|nr:response regulator [Opitutus sp. ER46]PTX94288.1 hypothetical protein DB354_11030 [Opitutus sp. ER46]